MRDAGCGARTPDPVRIQHADRNHRKKGRNDPGVRARRHRDAGDRHQGRTVRRRAGEDRADRRVRRRAGGAGGGSSRARQQTGGRALQEGRRAPDARAA